MTTKFKCVIVYSPDPPRKEKPKEDPKEIFSGKKELFDKEQGVNVYDVFNIFFMIGKNDFVVS